eukprot:4963995-Pyramimonas_sp.AAC.1
MVPVVQAAAGAPAVARLNRWPWLGGGWMQAAHSCRRPQGELEPQTRTYLRLLLSWRGRPASRSRPWTR